MWRTLAAVALGVAGAMYVSAHRPVTAIPDEPGWMRLPNGLRFIVRPIEGATQVVVLTQFDIGSDHDPDGRSGLAHLTEHLYVTSAAGATPTQTVDQWEAKYGTANCWASDEAPVDDVVKAADELVARFVADPPTDDEIKYIAGGHGPAVDRYLAVPKFPEMLAFGLADEASRHNDPGRIRHLLESLTKDDRARFAAKWLDPGNRVVAVARGPASPPLDAADWPPFVKELFEQATKPHRPK